MLCWGAAADVVSVAYGVVASRVVTNHTPLRMHVCAGVETRGTGRASAVPAPSPTSHARMGTPSPHVQVAIKVAQLGVLYLSDTIPLEAALLEGGTMEGVQFVQVGHPSHPAPLPSTPLLPPLPDPLPPVRAVACSAYRTSFCRCLSSPRSATAASALALMHLCACV